MNHLLQVHEGGPTPYHNFNGVYELPSNIFHVKELGIKANCWGIGNNPAIDFRLGSIGEPIPYNILEGMITETINLYAEKYDYKYFCYRQELEQAIGSHEILDFAKEGKGLHSKLLPKDQWKYRYNMRVIFFKEDATISVKDLYEGTAT